MKNMILRKTHMTNSTIDDYQTHDLSMKHLKPYMNSNYLWLIQLKILQILLKELHSTTWRMDSLLILILKLRAAKNTWSLMNIKKLLAQSVLQRLSLATNCYWEIFLFTAQILQHLVIPQVELCIFYLLIDIFFCLEHKNNKNPTTTAFHDYGVDIEIDNIEEITNKQKKDTVDCKKAFNQKKHKSARFLFAICACGTVIDILESVALESTMLVLVFLLLMQKKFGKLPDYIFNYSKQTSLCFLIY